MTLSWRFIDIFSFVNLKNGFEFRVLDIGKAQDPIMNCMELNIDPCPVDIWTKQAKATFLRHFEVVLL